MILEDDIEERRVKLLRAWADDLDRKGFTGLRVNLEAFPLRPEGFGQHVPDIVATRPDGRRLVGEIWMCEPLERGEDMFTRAMNYSYRGDVVMLLVPLDCLDQAEQLIAEWGLSSEVFVQGILD